MWNLYHREVASEIDSNDVLIDMSKDDKKDSAALPVVVEADAKEASNKKRGTESNQQENANKRSKGEGEGQANRT